MMFENKSGQYYNK